MRVVTSCLGLGVDERLQGEFPSRQPPGPPPLGKGVGQEPGGHRGNHGDDHRHRMAVRERRHVRQQAEGVVVNGVEVVGDDHHRTVWRWPAISVRTARNTCLPTTSPGSMAGVATGSSRTASAGATSSARSAVVPSTSGPAISAALTALASGSSPNQERSRSTNSA